MLAIRLQRIGRSGHAQFRLIVQDSRFSPKSGRVVAYLGSYNPHTKATVLDQEKAAQYLQNGAQPSDRVARLIAKEGVKLPSWVKSPTQKKRAIRHPEKLRKNRPAGEPAPEPAKEELAEQTDSEAQAPAEPEKEVAAKQAEASEGQPEEAAQPEESPAVELEEKVAEAPPENSKPQKSS